MATSYESYCRERKAALDKERALGRGRSMSEVVDEILEIVSSDEDPKRKQKLDTAPITREPSYSSWSLSSNSIVVSYPSSSADDDDVDVGTFQKSIQSYTSQLFSPLYEVTAVQHNVFQENRRPLPKAGHTPKFGNLCYNLVTQLSDNQNFPEDSALATDSKMQPREAATSGKNIKDMANLLKRDTSLLPIADTQVSTQRAKTRSNRFLSRAKMMPLKKLEDTARESTLLQFDRPSSPKKNEAHVRTDWNLGSFKSADSGDLSLEPLLHAFEDELEQDESLGIRRGVGSREKRDTFSWADSGELSLDLSLNAFEDKHGPFESLEIRRGGVSGEKNTFSWDDSGELSLVVEVSLTAIEDEPVPDESLDIRRGEVSGGKRDTFLSVESGDFIQEPLLSAFEEVVPDESLGTTCLGDEVDSSEVEEKKEAAKYDVSTIISKNESERRISNMTVPSPYRIFQVLLYRSFSSLRLIKLNGMVPCSLFDSIDHPSIPIRYSMLLEDKETRQYENLGQIVSKSPTSSCQQNTCRLTIRSPSFASSPGGNRGCFMLHSSSFASSPGGNGGCFMLDPDAFCVRLSNWSVKKTKHRTFPMKTEISNTTDKEHPSASADDRVPYDDFDDNIGSTLSPSTRCVVDETQVSKADDNVGVLNITQDGEDFSKLFPTFSYDSFIGSYESDELTINSIVDEPQVSHGTADDLFGEDDQVVRNPSALSLLASHRGGKYVDRVDVLEDSELRAVVKLTRDGEDAAAPFLFPEFSYDSYMASGESESDEPTTLAPSTSLVVGEPQISHSTTNELFDDDDRVVLHPSALSLMTSQGGGGGGDSVDHNDLLRDSELRAVMKLTRDGEDVSTLFPSFSFDSYMASCESDDGLNSEIGALQALEVDLRQEIETAVAVDSTILPPLTSPIQTPVATQYSYDSSIAIFCAAVHDDSSSCSGEDSMPCIRRVHFNEEVQEFIFFNEIRNEPRRGRGTVTEDTFLDDVIGVFEDLLDELSFACVSVSRAMDRTRSVSTNRKIRRSAAY